MVAFQSSHASCEKCTEPVDCGIFETKYEGCDFGLDHGDFELVIPTYLLTYLLNIPIDSEIFFSLMHHSQSINLVEHIPTYLDDGDLI